jgi:hypothetical protein
VSRVALIAHAPCFSACPRPPGLEERRVNLIDRRTPVGARKVLTGPRLERLLDVLLERNWIDQQPNKAAGDQTAAIIAQQGRFVALCEPSGRFRRLIDRDALVQDAAKRAWHNAFARKEAPVRDRRHASQSTRAVNGVSSFALARLGGHGLLAQ